MESQVTPSDVHEFMASLGGFAKDTPITVEATEPNNVRVRWSHDEEKLRPGGYVSGPTLFTIADLCGWVLTFTTEGITPMAVTWDLHITYLRPALGGDVIGVGRMLKRGRKLIYGDVTMYIDGKPDKPVAHATVTYALP